MGVKSKPIPLLIGLAGIGAFAWGLYHLMLIGSCGGEGVQPCPPGSGKYFVGVSAGMPIAIIATIAGGGGITFVGMFLAVGASSIAAGLSGDATEPGQETFLFIFGGAFALSALVPLLLVPFARQKAKRAAGLVTNGTQAVGTVIDVNDTGVTINNNPRVKLRFKIEPTDGTAPFEAAKTVTVSRVEIPRAGDRYPVWFDPSDHGSWAFGSDVTGEADPAVRRLFALAGRMGASPPVPAPADPVAPVPSPEDPFVKLSKLNDLRMAGTITDEEFTAQKQRLLESIV